MRYTPLPGPRPSLLQRIVGAIVGVIALVSLFFLGVVAWIIFAGIVLVGGIALSIWLWRQRRRIDKIRKAHDAALRQQAGDGPTRQRSEGSGGSGRATIIEGEYVVLSEKRRERR